jgi:hypothetical protein
VPHASPPPPSPWHQQQQQQCVQAGEQYAGQHGPTQQQVEAYGRAWGRKRIGGGEQERGGRAKRGVGGGSGNAEVVWWVGSCQAEGWTPLGTKDAPSASRQLKALMMLCGGIWLEVLGLNMLSGSVAAAPTA